MDTASEQEGHQRPIRFDSFYTLSPNTEVKSCQVIGENTEMSDIVLPNWGPFENVFDHRGLRTEFVFTK